MRELSGAGAVVEHLREEQRTHDNSHQEEPGEDRAVLQDRRAQARQPPNKIEQREEQAELVRMFELVEPPELREIGSLNQPGGEET